MGIGSTASSKGDFLLYVIIATLVLAFITLNLHANDNSPTSNGKCKEVSITISIFNQMAIAALGTFGLWLFRVGVQENCTTHSGADCKTLW